ncbi:low affinity immunoglobulin gamma Fc region receptor III-like [Passerculus sandwichensis]
MPWPNPAVPSPMVALAGWCPLSPAGAETIQILVEPPWTPPVLWDRVTLTCQGSGTAGATAWYKDGERWGQEGRDHFTVTERGTYECYRPDTGRSPPVTVSNDPLVLQVPVRALLEGDTVTLRCRGWKNRTVTSVSFYREGKELMGLPDGTELSLSPLQLNHSGRYSCRGWVEYWTSEKWWQSVPVTVTVHVAAGVSGALLFLLLLMGVIVAWHRRHRVAARKNQERAPPDPQIPPEEGEVLYTHVVVTKRAGVSPRATTLQDPQVTYAELRGPQGQPQEAADIYWNVQ